MSHTTSRGLYSPAHWTSAAIAVREALKVRRGTSVLTVEVVPGALESLERFFKWALMGLNDPRWPRELRTPAMAPMSCFSTFTSVLRSLGMVYGSSMVRQHAEAHLKLIRRIKAHYTLAGKTHQLERLDRFLEELVRQGESARRTALAI